MQLDDAWQRRTEGEALAECLAIATCDADVESLLATLTTRECYEIVAAAFTAASLTDEERKKSLSSPTACTGKSAEAVDEDIAR